MQCHHILTNKDRPVGNVKLKGSLGCTDHEMVDIEIPGAMTRVRSKPTVLNFRRVDFGLT